MSQPFSVLRLSNCHQVEDKSSLPHPLLWVFKDPLFSCFAERGFMFSRVECFVKKMVLLYSWSLKLSHMGLQDKHLTDTRSRDLKSEGYSLGSHCDLSFLLPMPLYG